MKRKLEILILGTCALIGLALALSSDYLPQRWFKLDYLISLSSLLTVASFSVRAMLPLRALAVASQVLAIPYFVLQPTPLWTPVGWTALFMAINLYHITRILLERRPVKFSDDEQRLYDLTFRNFGARDFLKLLKLGEWKTAHQGDSILSQGEPISHIAVPISGSLSAVTQGGRAVRLGPGELVGAGVGLTAQPSPFDAAFAEDTHYMRWSVADIDRFLDRNPELTRKFNDVVNRYLVAQINKLALHVESD